MTCFSLYTTSRLITRIYKPLLDEFDITYPQLLVLVRLNENNPQTVDEIGKALLLDSGTLTPLLKRLEKKGMVTRERDFQDERKVIVTITEKSKILLQKNITHLFEQVTGAFGLDDKEMQILQSLLSKSSASLYRE